MSSETKKLIEAGLFIAGRPLSLEEIAVFCNSGNMGSIRRLIEELQEDYNTRDSALRIENMSEGYRMTVVEEIEKDVVHLAPESEIPSTVLKTLALIAHEQPIKQSEVVKVRGNRAYRYIKELREQGLIEAKREGRTRLLETTPKFKEYFQIDDLKDVAIEPEEETEIE